MFNIIFVRSIEVSDGILKHRMVSFSRYISNFDLKIVPSECIDGLNTKWKKISACYWWFKNTISWQLQIWSDLDNQYVLFFVPSTR